MGCTTAPRFSRMNVASARAVRADVPLFADGLGERYVVADPSTGEPIQLLAIAPGLATGPSFDVAIRERVARFANFRHASYAAVRRVERLPDGRLAILSDHVDGTRLSEMLATVHAQGLVLDTSASLSLVAQLLTAVVLLHENARDAAHGLLAPERIVVTEQARLVIVEHVMGSAVEQLNYGRERLWKEFRTAVPASAGVPRLDHRADVNSIGLTALSLILGRPLTPGEFPHAVPGLIMQAHERSQLHGERPLPNGIRNWLARTLQLDVRRAFASAPESLAALADTLASDPSCAPAPIALETFLTAYHAGGPHVSRPDCPVGVHRVAPVPPPDPGPVHQSPLVPTLAQLIRVDDLALDAGAPPDPDDDFTTVAGSSASRHSSAAVAVAAANRDSLGAHDHVRGGSDEGIEEGIEEGVEEGVEEGIEQGIGDEQAESEPSAYEALSAHPLRSSDAHPVPHRLSRWWSSRAALVGLALVLGGGALLASRLLTGAPAAGTLVVQSSPAGVDVYIDGVHHGVTPAELSLPAGSHILELRGRGVPRVIPLQVPAGGQLSQYLEFADTPRTGMLVVHSQPPGARVLVDGEPRGTTPITIEGLKPGSREVVLQNDQGSSRHVVRILAGTTASLVAPVVGPAAAGPVSGWISARAPFLLEIFEGGRLIGTTETDRIMLAAGRHVLEFVNQALGYRETQTVQVLPGRVLQVTLNLPTGRVSLNADPWAEIWIDGRSVGDTPIGNLELTIGAYEVVFKHPQFGERRHAISVTTAAPVRLSVSMR